VTSFGEVLAAVKALFPAMTYEIEAGEQSLLRPAPLDISRAKRHLGWEPRFTIGSAFADYLAEFDEVHLVRYYTPVLDVRWSFVCSHFGPYFSGF